MELKNKAWLYWLIPVLAVAGILYYFLREEKPEVRKIVEQPPRRTAFKGSNLTEQLDGKKVWDLSARVMEVESKTGWVYLTEMKGTFYQPDGSRIDIAAGSGLAKPGESYVELADGLQMTTDDGTKLTAAKGRYSAKEHKIHVSGTVRFVREDAVLTADELESDDKFETIEARGNARIVKGGPEQ